MASCRRISGDCHPPLFFFDINFKFIGLTLYDYISLMISQSLRIDDPRFVNVHIISNMPTINGLLFLIFKSFVSNRIIGFAAIICSFLFLVWIGLRRKSSISAVPAALLASHYM